MIHSFLLYFIYFIISLTIIFISYIAVFYYKKNISIYYPSSRNNINLNICKNKYNINSTLLSYKTNKSNSLSSTKFNTIDYSNCNNVKLSNFIINKYFNEYNNDTCKNIINSYLTCKQNIDNLSLHNYSSITEFINIYKNNIIKNKNYSYNVILKFYNNDYDFKLVHMKKLQLVKIVNNSKYIDILNSVQYKKIFISSSGDDNLISFGECIFIDCSNDDLASIFNNKDLNDYKFVCIYIWSSAKFI